MSRPGTRAGSRAGSKGPEVPPDIVKSLAAMADTMEKFSDKIELLTDRIDAIKSGERPTKERSRDLADIDEEDKEDESIPVRGLYGKCGPIETRFPYLDSKVRDQALGGSLPPESLPLLLPPTSVFARPPQEEALSFGFMTGPGGPVFTMPTQKSQGDAVAKFAAAIPTPATFLYAWSIYMELLVHGLGDPAGAKEAFAALFWYAQWIAEKLVTHTWESICKYHLRVCGKHTTGEFHVSRWYDSVNADAVTDLRLRPEPAKEARSGKDKDVSDQVCFKWNMGIGCKEPCSSNWLHKCEYCGGDHKKTGCKTISKA